MHHVNLFFSHDTWLLKKSLYVCGSRDFFGGGAGWRQMTDHNDVELYQVFFGGEGDGLECWRICHPRENEICWWLQLFIVFSLGRQTTILEKSSSTKDYNGTERCQQASVLHIAVTAARLWKTLIRGGPHHILSGGWYAVSPNSDTHIRGGIHHI